MQANILKNSPDMWDPLPISSRIPHRRTSWGGGCAILETSRDLTVRCYAASRRVGRPIVQCFKVRAVDCRASRGLAMKVFDLPERPRILVITLRRLGDVLLTTPLIRTVRRGIPPSQLDVLTF